MTIISRTTPFWTAILGYFIMNEQILPIEIGGMFICFGAFLYITVNASKSEDDDAAVTSPDSSAAGQLLGIILIFICSWLMAGMFVANRRLKGMDQVTVMFFHGIFGFIMAIVFFGFEILFNENSLFFLNYTANQYCLVLLTCVFDTCCIYSGLQAA